LRGIVWRHGAGLEFGAPSGEFKLVDGELFLFAMKDELEAVGKERAEHGHLLVVIGAQVARSDGNNVVVVGRDPGWSARDGFGTEIVCGSDEQLQGVVLADEAVDALHDEVSAGFGIVLDRLDSGYFKGVEFWARRGQRGWGLRKDGGCGKSQGCCCDLPEHGAPHGATRE
jgi:hypothetical protein